MSSCSLVVRHASGYTLIEIIIVVALIGLLTGASIAGFNTLNKRQTVINAGKEVVSAMRTAQQRSSSGIKPPGCTQLVGYSIAALALSSQYTLSAVCSNNTYVIRTILLPTGVFFPSSFSSQFNVLTGGVDGTTGDIAMKSSFFTFKITLSSAGDISEKGLQ